MERAGLGPLFSFVPYAYELKNEKGAYVTF